MPSRSGRVAAPILPSVGRAFPPALSSVGRAFQPASPFVGRAFQPAKPSPATDTQPWRRRPPAVGPSREHQTCRPGASGLSRGPGDLRGSVRLLVALAAMALCLSGCHREDRGGVVTLACVGDIMLGRDVARTCAEKGDAYPFSALGDLLSSPGITCGNLEGVLSHGATRYPRVNSLFAPPRMAGVLQAAGFDVLSLANNHAIDCGRPGLRTTLGALQGAGITPVGAGATLAEARKGAVLSVRGLRVGFIAYSAFPYTDFVHDPDRESILKLNEDALRATLPALGARSDCLVVSVHWGKEGVRQTSAYERRLAHLCIDLGADVVIGHHAHVRGEVESYRGGVIAYCLGNLVFDEYSYGGNEGYVLLCELGREGLRRYETVEVDVVGCQARVVGER